MKDKSIKERRTAQRMPGLADEFGDDEQRKYTRIRIEGQVSYMTCDRHVLRGLAEIEDISQCGVLFRTQQRPKQGAIIALRLNDVQDVVSVNALLREDNGDVVGKVVRVRKQLDGVNYIVAVDFLRKGF